MGIDFPPPWEAGSHCATCEASIFRNRTPRFVYAQTVGLGKCPLVPPEVPDPNRVVRMIQSIMNPCQWFGSYTEGLFTFGWTYTFSLGSSFMFIGEAGGALVFNDIIPAPCADSFVNDLVCGPPVFPMFSGGTVDCFW